MTDQPFHSRTLRADRMRHLWPFAAGAGAVLAELLALYFLYHPGNFVFECRAYASPLFCGFFSAGVMRMGAVIGALMLYLLARPAPARALGTHVRPGWGWGAVQIAGFGLILAPLGFLAEGTPAIAFAAAVICWIAGAGALVLGSGFFLAPPAGWVAAVRVAGPALPVILIAALALPDVAPWIRDGVQHLWHLEIVTRLTFWSSAGLLELTGSEVYTDLAGPYIGVGEFVVGVGRQCSGVEGFVLITGFLLLYFALFRDRLRFPRAWILLPIGLALSWCLNVVRIAVLILIGAHVSPDLAVDGFHSHAGWLMFTVLSVSLAAIAHRLSWLRRDAAAGTASSTPAPLPRAARPAFFADPATAKILPFLVFMASALLAPTFFEVPGTVYPLRALAMAAVLALFWPILAAMAWRIDPLAAGAGLGVGVLWLATAPAQGAGDMALSAALAAMPGWLFVLWVLSRVLGTTVLVPLIEELFFRGYVLARLDMGGLAWRLVALGVSSGLFACLHDRWLAAGLSGLVFGLLYLRRGSLADAVIAHGLANAVIAAWAVRQGDWSVI